MPQKFLNMVDQVMTHFQNRFKNPEDNEFFETASAKSVLESLNLISGKFGKYDERLIGKYIDC